MTVVKMDKQLAAGGSDRSRTALRKKQIIGLIEVQSQVSVDVLACHFKVSKETIRRDLTNLAERGLVRKLHGGATHPHRTSEASFQVRMTENADIKRAIAEKAATLFASGESLFIDTGSTTLLFANALAGNSGLTIVTNGVDIALALGKSSPANRLFLLGGEYYPANSETLGALAAQQIAGFQSNHAVLTVGAISLSGIADFDLNKAEIAKAMIRQSEKITVLCDHTKFGQTATFNVAPLASIDRIVTNVAPKGALATALARAGVEIIETG